MYIAIGQDFLFYFYFYFSKIEVIFKINQSGLGKGLGRQFLLHIEDNGQYYIGHWTMMGPIYRKDKRITHETIQLILQTVLYIWEFSGCQIFEKTKQLLIPYFKTIMQENLGKKQTNNFEKNWKKIQKNCGKNCGKNFGFFK